MNAVNRMGLKAVACGAAALALTVASSWTFVKSESVARWVESAPIQMAASSAMHSGTQLAQVGATGLLE